MLGEMSSNVAKLRVEEVLVSLNEVCKCKEALLLLCGSTSL